MRKNQSLHHSEQTRMKVWPLVGALAAAGLASAILGGCAMTDSKSSYSGSVVPEMQIRPMPLITRGDKSPEGYYALGKYYFYQERLEKAKEAFMDAVRLDPGYVDALNGLGAVYDRLGQYESAQKAYGAALLKDPQAAHVLANMGYSLLLAGKSSESLEPLKQAIALDPGNTAARQHLASAAAHAGAKARTEEAPTAIATAPATESLVAASQPARVEPKAAETPQADVGSAEAISPTAKPMVQVVATTLSDADVSVPVEGPIANVVTSGGISTAEVKSPLASMLSATASAEGKMLEAATPVKADTPVMTSKAAGPMAAPVVQIVSTTQIDTAASPPLQGPIVNIVTSMTSKGIVTIEARSPLASVLPVSLPSSDGVSTDSAQATLEPRVERVVNLAISPAKAPAAGQAAAPEVQAKTVVAKADVQISEVLGGLRIEVSNGNGVTGMARAVGTEMHETGLKVARITNARPFNKAQTVILCRPELKEAALALAQSMPSKPKVVFTDIKHRRVDVRVVLGADSVLARQDGVKSPYLVASLSR